MNFDDTKFMIPKRSDTFVVIMSCLLKA